MACSVARNLRYIVVEVEAGYNRIITRRKACLINSPHFVGVEISSNMRRN